MKRLFLGLLCLPLCANAAVRLPDIFSNHCVLQRSSHTTVWGSASPGEKVRVDLGSVVTSAGTADEHGHWQVELNLQTCPQGPLDLGITGSNNLTVRDVLVGDVWICSGQSNMEFKLSQSIGGPEEVAQSDNPRLRYFIPERQAVDEPAENLGGRWVVASPATAGIFSAAAWYFAKAVQASEGVTLGLVDTSWGGTPAEAWISSEGMDLNPALKQKKDLVLAKRKEAVESLTAFPGAIAAWLEKNQRQDRKTGNPDDFAMSDISMEGWKEVAMPGSLSKTEFADSGAFWLRTKVDVPPDRAGTYLPLMLGTPHDFDTIYWNGKKIGETTTKSSTSSNPDLNSTTNRRYDVPGYLVKAGLNTLAIRLFSPAVEAGIEAKNLSAGWTIRLDKPWFAKTEYALPPLSANALSNYPQRPPLPVMAYYTATYLSNGMVHPLKHLSLRGVIWYQGEANVGRAWQYRETFPLMISDWRRLFERSDLPFYFCQLSNHRPKLPQPADSEWAEIREAQSTALAMPGTGMATLVDIGEENDIHFRNKKDAGERLAAIAIAKTYGRKVPFSGPLFESVDIQENSIRVHFSHLEGGLLARELPAEYQPKSSFPATKPLVLNRPESKLQGFAICGEDQQWKWADAKIDGETVLVSSEDVPRPRFIRYAWSDNPTCNLYNRAGFPAAPFRSDAFPLTTTNRKY